MYEKITIFFKYGHPSGQWLEVDFVPKTRPNFLKTFFLKFGRVLGTKSTSLFVKIWEKVTFFFDKKMVLFGKFSEIDIFATIWSWKKIKVFRRICSSRSVHFWGLLRWRRRLGGIKIWLSYKKDLEVKNHRTFTSGFFCKENIFWYIPIVSVISKDSGNEHISMSRCGEIFF